MKTCLRLLLPLLLAAAMTACSARPGNSGAASPDDTPQELLAVDGEIIQADGDTLTLQLDDGSSVTFATADAAAEEGLDLSAGQPVRIHFLGSLKDAGEGAVRAVRIEQGA